ncbi:F-box only protein 7 isoform X1 [Protopterus annectens]|uniref:F-box only protein 7 isoform X1 n=1 Tax=Protopterus annectens TaxID=7888 RepID=UPI001CFA92F4|nr:F-box only protein 7 isoform X1 [Protopterus annectens]XP_043943413.1 F-box only protein 7 isoform X1 [Protopterus annectens]XP_043943414.1 F-box only protein 7 isoform X1 [Protopterus annectens]XP_043943415.1 F-box only protein 7 isoform X1 [Protopterus annectens]
MKLRVNTSKRTHPRACWVEIPEENPSLGDLRAVISENLLPVLGYSSDVQFAISLNGRDALTEDEASLSSLGVVHGDLVWIEIHGSSPAVVCASDQSNMPAACDFRQKAIMISENGTGESSSLVCENQAGASSESVDKGPPPDTDSDCVLMLDSEVEEGEGVGSYLLEPMLCCEATDGKVPHSLETLYHSAHCQESFDFLIVVLHLLMLETGYLPQGTGTNTKSMPDKWKNGGVYKLNYIHPLCEEGLTTLVCTPMGKLLVVNALLKVENKVKVGKRLQLPPVLYISSPTHQGQQNAAEIYKDLQKLSRVFKDQLVYPLLASARQALNLPDVFGLVVLPLELKLRIFRLLDVESILKLSSTCRDLSTDLNDKLLWRFLYIRDFKDPFTKPLDEDWKELYKMKAKQKKRAQQQKTRMFQSRYIIPRLPPNSPSSFYPPGIIGGEYDERPILPYVGNPFNSLIPGLGSTSTRCPPVRPHSDPASLMQGLDGLFQGRAGPGERFPPRPTQGRRVDYRRAFI